MTRQSRGCVGAHEHGTACPYALLTNDNGILIDDGVVVRLAEDYAEFVVRWRLEAAEESIEQAA